jgi:hypothetical protein
MSGFTAGWGRWLGSAEVFDGAGRFVGNGMDMRQVQNLGAGKTRIDVTFIGPFKAAGHYFIQDHGDYRLYEGPINVGYAEVLAPNLIDAQAYWAALGMAQRFFLMVLPEQNVQFSLAQMSRGDQLVYTVVGENRRVDDTPAAQPEIVNGAAVDLHDDPTAGRGELFLQRQGTWSGEVTILDAARQVIGQAPYSETLSPHNGTLEATVHSGAYADSLTPHDYTLCLQTNHWQAWSNAGEVVGSYNLCGGRALSGQVYHVRAGLRVWQREVVNHAGTHKALVQHWYRGQARVAVHYGVVEFQSR